MEFGPYTTNNLCNSS